MTKRAVKKKKKKSLDETKLQHTCGLYQEGWV